MEERELRMRDGGRKIDRLRRESTGSQDGEQTDRRMQGRQKRERKQ